MNLRFVRLLCLLGCGACAVILSAAEIRLDQPTSAGALAATALAAQHAASVPADWQAQRTPGGTAPTAPDARRIWTALDGWIKIPLDRASGLPLPAQPVRLPENWGPGLKRGYVAAWHVLRADLGPRLDDTLWLRFDAVAHVAEVFVNGRFAGRHLGGYTPFEFDISTLVRPGENTVAVYVRDETAVVDVVAKKAVSQVGVTRPNEWLSPGGITGGVFFESRATAHVAQVLVRPSTRRSELRITTRLRGPATEPAVTVAHAIYEWPGGTQPVMELPATVVAPGATEVDLAQPWADARRWSPAQPALYTLRTTVRAGAQTETIETRFGFREFWIEGKNFMLNGQPIHLLGPSLARDLEIANTPDVGRRYGRAVLEFFKRELHANAIRFHATIHPREAALAADEAGVLVVNQSGLWSAMRGYYTTGADELLINLAPQFAAWHARDANSPSVVIWDAENEMIRDERSPERERWVLALDDLLRKFDPALVIEHSGDAFYSPDQPVIHLHMQERYARAIREWRETGRVPLVMGEFWVGGRGGEGRLMNSREYRDRTTYAAEELQLYRDAILEMRYHGVSGVMPFWLDRTLFTRLNETIRHSFDPATDPIFKLTHPTVPNYGAAAYAPVTAIVWPRSSSVAANTALEKEIAVCNDTEIPQTLTVTATLGRYNQRWQTTVPPAGQARRKMRFTAPASGPLVVTVTDAQGRAHQGDELQIHVLPAAIGTTPVLQRRLVVCPAPSPEIAAALSALGLAFETARTLPADAKGTLVLVPPDAPRAALGRNQTAVRRYLEAGGRMLVLPQTARPDWLPANLTFWSSAKKSAPEFTLAGWPDYTRDLMFAREVPLTAPGHPAFAGLSPEDFAWWQPGDGRVSDDTFARPSAFDLAAGAPYRVLAGCTRRENGSLIETTFGSGTAIFCQLQVLAHDAAPAARAVFFNLLRYLDGAAWTTTRQTVALAGRLEPAQLAALTGLPAENFSHVNESVGTGIVLAGDGADPAQLGRLARAGATVIVLSTETASRLSGYAAAGNPDLCYAGTRADATDDPLLWGVATASFAPIARSPARGALKKFPAEAKVLLHGLALPLSRLPRENNSGARSLEMMGAGEPIAVSEQRGAGRIVVTTIEPWNGAVESHRQLLATLLANAGVAVPPTPPRSAVVSVKRTVPLRLDGRLDDWTNDMEDSAVSLFKHAEPVVITSRDAVSGAAASDLDQSGVLYFLHDPQALYVGGILFSRSEPPRVELEVAGRRVQLDSESGVFLIDGRALEKPSLALGEHAAREIGDTRLLNLLAINPHINSLHSAGDAPGRTFEFVLPWAALGLAEAPAELRAVVRLARPGKATLQQPPPDREDIDALTLRLER